MKTINKYTLIFSVMLFSRLANAAGGLDKVNTLFDNVLAVIKPVSLTIFVISVIVAGIKIANGISYRELGPLTIGGVVIGAAVSIGSYLIDY